MSGTEGTQLSLRIARAATGRNVILRITGHFNGWHDYGMFGLFAPYDQVSSAGVPDLSAVVAHVAQGDMPALQAALSGKEIAAVILEPEGARAGAIPMGGETLRAIRQATKEAGSLLIFDEVISGFRMAPGGAQEYFGVTPDLTVFAKAIAGGLPGGAVAGPRAIMELLAHRTDSSWNRRNRVVHTGTWNGNPLSAAAGIAALGLAATGRPQDEAARAAHRLRAGLNGVLRARNVDGFAYGRRSSFRLVMAGEGELPPGRQGDETLASELPSERLLAGIREPLRSHLHLALLLNGLDFMLADHGWVSCVHDDDAIDEAVSRFDDALSDLVTSGAIEGARESH
jgi:glutamate-1-semialdehyde 2,1-aminomutase